MSFTNQRIRSEKTESDLVRFRYVRCWALVESGERTLFGLVSSSGLAKQKLSLTIHELTVFSSSVCEMCREESLERRLPPNGINDLCRGNGTGVGLAPLRAVTNSGHQWITWLPGLRRGWFIWSILCSKFRRRTSSS